MPGVSPLKVFHCVCTSKNLVLSPQSQSISNAATVEKIFFFLTSSGGGGKLRDEKNHHDCELSLEWCAAADFDSHVYYSCIVFASTWANIVWNFFAFKKVVSSSCVCVVRSLLKLAALTAARSPFEFTSLFPRVLDVTALSVVIH